MEMNFPYCAHKFECVDGELLLLDCLLRVELQVCRCKITTRMDEKIAELERATNERNHDEFMEIDFFIHLMTRSRVAMLSLLTDHVY